MQTNAKRLQSTGPHVQKVYLVLLTNVCPTAHFFPTFGSQQVLFDRAARRMLKHALGASKRRKVVLE